MKLNSTFKNFFAESLEPSPFLTRMIDHLAFGHQFDQIKSIKKMAPEIASQKKTVLKNHIGNVSKREKIALVIRLTVEKVNLIRSLLLNLFIHPAIRRKDFNHTNETCIYRAMNVLNNEEIVDIFSKDHQLLNARVIYANAAKDKNKLTMVLCTGNLGSLEFHIEEARRIAKFCDINVLIYNSRGLGLSLGKEYTLEEAVEDNKAAINHALENLCDHNPQRLCVFGISLGGGITATALKQLQKESGLPPIGVYINHHSFTSLQHFVKGWVKIPALITRLGLAFIKINPLNTGKILSTTQLAQKTIVVTCEKDSLMKGPGRLSKYLEKRPLPSEILFEVDGNFHGAAINLSIIKKAQEDLKSQSID